MSRCLVTVALLLSVGCASTFRTAEIAFVTSNIADIHSTHRAIQAGATEANPLLPRGLGAQIVVKAIQSAAILWMAEREAAHGHKTGVTVLLCVVSGVYAVIAARNYQLAERLR